MTVSQKGKAARKPGSGTPTERAPVRFPVIVGDIGGTNARFALVDGRDAPLTSFEPVPTTGFPDIEGAVEKGVFAKTDVRPRTAIIDLAGPIVGDAVDLTNADWIVRPREMIDRLGVEDVILLNDFEALALALTALDDADLRAIGDEAAQKHAAKVVLGPGTGLGVGGLVEAGGTWVPVPGEGGHVTFGPVEADEFPLWANIEPELGRISAEALLSGRGLVRLYRAVAKTDDADAPLKHPEEVTKAALEDTDPVATRTLRLYCRLLGRLAGDMTLTFMARGGAYIAGGIAPRILPFLMEGEFRRAFEAKAPHDELMASIPTWVIVSKNPALQGLAAYAQAPERFGVNLEGRRWLKDR
jgi:glucokinase